MKESKRDYRIGFVSLQFDSKEASPTKKRRKLIEDTRSHNTNWYSGDSNANHTMWRVLKSINMVNYF